MKKKMDHLKSFLSPWVEEATPPSSECCPSLEPIYDTIAPSPDFSYYTCPMHTAIRQLGPGQCPHCGMALDSEDILGILSETSELKDMTQRFWIACIFSLPLLILTMGVHLIPFRWMTTFSSKWIEFALATPVVMGCGWPFFQRAWTSLRNRSLNMFTLIGMGIGIAYLYSFFIILFQNRIEHYFGPNIILDVYFESAAVITTFVLLGQIFELKARAKTNLAIQKLLHLSPTTARIVRDNGTEEDIPLSHVQAEDIVRVLPGDKIPVDGIILEGNSTIDESMITGESLPLFKSRGDKVISGSLNRMGSILIRTECIGPNTLLSQIVGMVSKAQRTHVPIQRLSDTISGYFIPFVILSAVLSGLTWSLWGPEPKIGHALLSSLSVLIIACPCALGLATPLSIMVGIGRGALEGILIKNAEILETFEKIDTLVLDKTGTLTLGKPRLVSVVSLSKSLHRSQLLSLAASLEKNSEHPLAEAILEGAKLEEVPLLSVKNFQTIPGKGITGNIKNKSISLGGMEMLDFLKIDISDHYNKITNEQQKGHTIMFFIIDNTLEGFLSVADVLKKNTYDIIKHLEHEGLNIIMLTGDNRITAQAIAQEAGIKNIKADMLPNQKYDFIRDLQNEGRKVAMTGDGINDAPALAQADVGIAMGNGTDIAIESADITLISGDLKGILKARRLSQITLTNIRQNLFLAFIYNGLSLPIAAGVLYPSLGLFLNPRLASVVMGLSSVSVILNALRISKISIFKGKY